MREKPEFRLVDLRVVIERAVVLCRSELKKKIKQFALEIPENLHQIYTDALAVEQVMVNLLINATQAVNREDSRIDIRVIPGKNLLIEVSDNGRGIKDEDLKRIFDPFFTTRQPGGGTGLGLYVSRNIIEGLGGSIEAESEPGKGSIFRIILPAEKE